jgi:hypothetical protein
MAISSKTSIAGNTGQAVESSQMNRLGNVGHDANINCAAAIDEH